MARNTHRRRALAAISSPEARASVVRALEAGRFEVQTSEEWTRTVAKIESERFDVVIAEVEMPYVGGFDILRAIRFNHPGTLVFLLGNGGTDEEIRRARNRGAAGYIPKPVRERELTVEVAAAFEEMQSRRLLKSLGIKGGKLRMVG